LSISSVFIVSPLSMRSSQAVTVGSPLSTDYLPRPDPERGVFETLLVADGRAVELDAHLARLGASARELFGPPAMARVVGPARALVEARAAEVAPPADDVTPGAPTRPAASRPALARLRLTLTPNERGALDLAVVAAEVDPMTIFPPPERGVALAPVTVAAGLGRHKWADRRLLEQAADALDGRMPLIVDRDGTVLEAERANVFALRGDVLLTPPDDGTILPGIARDRAIAATHELRIEVQERPISLEELCRADEVFLTGSIRGIEPVSSIADQATPSVRAEGPIAARIGAVLRERWLGSG
jgi:para-aminobenzoate synthetase/4-amino-4-deoxychorismate lyase